MPYADPYLFPLCALLAAIGLVMLFRINDTLALKQASIFVAGAGAARGDDPAGSRLPRARALPVPDRHGGHPAAAGAAAAGRRGAQVNGAYLQIDLGPLSFQPAEVAKICIVIFLASYLHEKRELLTVAARRVAGVTIPPLKHFGPLLVVWGAAMVMLVLIRDLGSSLMFFGAFLALLYVATARLSYVVAGLVLFFAGAWVDGARDRARRRPGRHLARPLAQQGGRARARSSSRSSPRPTAGCSARGWGNRC